MRGRGRAMTQSQQVHSFLLELYAMASVEYVDLRLAPLFISGLADDFPIY